jgi:ectoine hydroxylase-related dioxygenase (phytanoyl-CoA dioxygenase family)
MILETDRSFAFPLRGVFDPDLLRSLREEFRRLEREDAERPLTDRDLLAQRIGSANDHVRKRMDWYRVWENVKPKHVEALMPFRLVTYPIQLRHLQNDEQLVPWHQDAGYMRLMPRQHDRIITCWIPLDDEPAKHATLCFPRSETWQPVHHQTSEIHGAVLDLDTPDIVSWDLALGDCLVFGDYRPHRTLRLPHLKLERYSIEARLVRAQDALSEKDYYDIVDNSLTRASA